MSVTPDSIRRCAAPIATTMDADDRRDVLFRTPSKIAAVVTPCSKIHHDKQRYYSPTTPTVSIYMRQKSPFKSSMQILDDQLESVRKLEGCLENKINGFGEALDDDSFEWEEVQQRKWTTPHFKENISKMMNTNNIDQVPHISTVSELNSEPSISNGNNDVRRITMNSGANDTAAISPGYTQHIQRCDSDSNDHFYSCNSRRRWGAHWAQRQTRDASYGDSRSVSRERSISKEINGCVQHCSVGNEKRFAESKSTLHSTEMWNVVSPRTPTSKTHLQRKHSQNHHVPLEPKQLYPIRIEENDLINGGSESRRPNHNDKTSLAENETTDKVRSSNISLDNNATTVTTSHNGLNVRENSRSFVGDVKFRLGKVQCDQELVATPTGASSSTCAANSLLKKEFDYANISEQYKREITMLSSQVTALQSEMQLYRKMVQELQEKLATKEEEVIKLGKLIKEKEEDSTDKEHLVEWLRKLLYNKEGELKKMDHHANNLKSIVAAEYWKCLQAKELTRTSQLERHNEEIGCVHNETEVFSTLALESGTCHKKETSYVHQEMNEMVQQMYVQHAAELTDVACVKTEAKSKCKAGIDFLHEEIETSSALTPNERTQQLPPPASSGKATFKAPPEQGPCDGIRKAPSRNHMVPLRGNEKGCFILHNSDDEKRTEQLSDTEITLSHALDKSSPRLSAKIINRCRDTCDLEQQKEHVLCMLNVKEIKQAQELEPISGYQTKNKNLKQTEAALQTEKKSTSKKAKNTPKQPEEHMVTKLKMKDVESKTAHVLVRHLQLENKLVKKAAATLHMREIDATSKKSQAVLKQQKGYAASQLKKEVKVEDKRRTLSQFKVNEGAHDQKLFLIIRK